MSFEFKLPNFQVETESERRLYSYLYQTVQQLNWAMKHLQTAKSSGSVLTLQPGTGERVKVSDADIGQLRDLIVKSADIVDSFYCAISRRLRGAYVAQSEFGTYAQETGLALEASDRRIDQNYTVIRQITGTVAELSQQMTKTNAYIRTGLIGEDADGTAVYGLEIGQTNEVNGTEVFSKYARFSSSRLSFYDQNDTEVAYISDYKLYITNVHITGTLTIGDYEIDTSDGLAFRWIGGEG